MKSNKVDFQKDEINQEETEEEEEDTTTDQDENENENEEEEEEKATKKKSTRTKKKQQQQQSNKYVSIKFSGETWKNKVLARKLKNFLRENVQYRNKSFSKNYIYKFLEAAQISSKFTDQEDQDRAFDEVTSVFEEWNELHLTQELPEYRNQTLLDVLTQIGVPWWMNFIFQKTSSFLNIVGDRTETNSFEQIQSNRSFLIKHKDTFGNVWAHFLIQFINKRKYDGIYLFHAAMLDPLWFGTIRTSLQNSLHVKNKASKTPLDLLNSSYLNVLFNFDDVSSPSLSKTMKALDKQIEEEQHFLKKDSFSIPFPTKLV